MGRPRRKSSNLSSDPRGDTGAPAWSTVEHRPALPSPPLPPSTSGAPQKGRKRRKARSLLRRWRNLSFTHTWVNPLILILIILFLYAINPTESNPLHKALFVSHALPAGDPLIPTWARHNLNVPTYYGKGMDDFKFVAFYTIVLTFTREFLMQRLIRPLAVSYGIRSRRKQARFMEQVYTAIYFSIIGPAGLYVMSRTPVWYFNTTAMYEDFPHRSHDALFKVYYLIQASYWVQQAIVLLLQLEEPRKDFKELVAHHALTIALIWLSYRFHFTYMGIAVYITHDISDFFLATSKTLHYLNSPITEPYYCLFNVIWIYARHYLNLRILYSVTTEFVTVGPFELNWETEQYKSRLSQCIAFSLLACLQAINIFWLYLILRIAYNIAFMNVTEDVRSDEEDSVVEDEKVDQQTPLLKTKAGKAAVANGHTKEPVAALSTAREAEQHQVSFRESKVNGSVRT